MVIVGWYILFALTTALVSLYEIVHPVLQELSILEPNSILLENKMLSYITFTFMGTLFAPILIFPCIVPKLGEQFRTALVAALQE